MKSIRFRDVVFIVTCKTRKTAGGAAITLAHSDVAAVQSGSYGL